MNKQNKLSAFTLAEVLITLMVIGILAVVTIPSILQSYEERESISKLRKVYSVLKQAYQLAEIENGPPDTWNLSNSNSLGYIKKYLNIVKECPGNTGGCTYMGYYKWLNGNDYPHLKTDIDNAVKYVLADGVTMFSLRISSSCKMEAGKVEGSLYSCASFDVDLNGQKPPNQFGKDLFAFYLTKAGIFPYGGSAIDNYYNHNTYCKNTNTEGYSCARWVIERGNMDYLHKTTTW